MRTGSIFLRGTAAASQECCRRYFPMRAATSHAQVHQMPRSDRARRTTAWPVGHMILDFMVVHFCMALRLFDNSDALLRRGGLIYGHKHC